MGLDQTVHGVKPTLNILILGASGFLGSYIYGHLRLGHTVRGTYYSNGVEGLDHLDLKDDLGLRRLVDDFRPELILNCAGMTRPDVCEIEPQRAYHDNVLGTRNVLEASEARMVYFSTDYVFDGRRGSYHEGDEPAPVNQYGLTKLEAEKLVLSANPRNLVLRLAGLYGFSLQNNEFIKSLLSDEPLRRPVDLIGSHTLLDDVIVAMEELLDTDGGIYHVAGTPPESRFSFTRRATRALTIPNHVVACKAIELGLAARRPGNCSLVSLRHQIRMRSNDEGLAITAKAWHAARTL